MKLVLTAQQMRAVDGASANFGMPAAVLMENAGRALADAAARLAGPGGRFLVLCGSGNNGGDGLVAARFLALAGRAVMVELVGEPAALRGEPKRNLEALAACGVALGAIPAAEARPGDVVIDALLGTGLSRAPEGRYAEAIDRAMGWRAAGARVLAADLPSGLDSDTGLPHAPCITADATASFGFLKRGQAQAAGAARCGALEVVDIGIPPAAAASLEGPSVSLLEEADVRARLPAREAEGHKGTFGHVLVVAGSRGKSGAAALAGLGAVRAGAGLVTLAARGDALDAALTHAPELMGAPLAADDAGGETPTLGPADLEGLVELAAGKSAVVLGPGIARGPRTGELVAGLASRLRVPLVIDADGLNALGAAPEQLRGAAAPVLLTPHPGEAARLLGCPTGEIQADRVGAARRLAERATGLVMLKGARTVIAASDGRAFINPTGNPGMGTGGTGDVLAGVLGGLLAQGLAPLDAALIAAYVHGRAGDLVVRRTGQAGLIASDLLGGLCEVWVEWGR